LYVEEKILCPSAGPKEKFLSPKGRPWGKFLCSLGNTKAKFQKQLNVENTTIHDFYGGYFWTRKKSEVPF